MGLSEQYAADLRRMIEERPTSFGYGGGRYTAIRSKLSGEFAASEYGVIAGYRFSLRVLCSDLPQIPKSGDKVEIGTEVYRIMEPVEVDSFDVSVLLHLASEAR